MTSKNILEEERHFDLTHETLHETFNRNKKDIDEIHDW